jgi:hypothetical protein
MDRFRYHVVIFNYKLRIATGYGSSDGCSVGGAVVVVVGCGVGVVVGGSGVGAGVGGAVVVGHGVGSGVGGSVGPCVGADVFSAVGVGVAVGSSVGLPSGGVTIKIARAVSVLDVLTMNEYALFPDIHSKFSSYQPSNW